MTAFPGQSHLSRAPSWKYFDGKSILGMGRRTEIPTCLQPAIADTGGVSTPAATLEEIHVNEALDFPLPPTTSTYPLPPTSAPAGALEPLVSAPHRAPSTSGAPVSRTPISIAPRTS